jgi:hypothetical protein
MVTSQVLTRVALTYNAQGKPSFGSIQQYTFNIVNASGGLVSIKDQFGDIAMTPGGRLYLANTGTNGADAAFYTLDTATLTPGSNNNATVIKGPAGGNPSLQLSFSCDYRTLWAQSYEDCKWYTIDPATGVPTLKFTLQLKDPTNPGANVGKCLRDLGGAACT